MNRNVAPFVVIVGRPNVGKSTLFNRLIGRRRALVHDRPGVTRDRIFHWMETEAGDYWIIDTGGLSDEPDIMSKAVSRQVRAALEEANVFLFVVDAASGVVPDDLSIANEIRKFGKPVVLAVNKVDPSRKLPLLPEFARLGFHSQVEVSAEHGSGIDELRAQIESHLPQQKRAVPEKEDVVRLAILGRPNVGKSSLGNAILKEERLIVSEIPGTTRDSVDVEISRLGKKFVLVDTAGIRRRGKLDDVLEKYSVIMALRALERCHVALLVLDAEDMMTTQDERIAASILEMGKGIVLVANKWDLIHDSEKMRHHFREEVYARAPFLSFASIHFVSAKTGMRVDQLLKEAMEVQKKFHRSVTAEKLAEIFNEIASAYHPGGPLGAILRLDNLRQVSGKIPTFVLTCNRPDMITTSYRRYWTNALREKLSLTGVPLRVEFKRRKPSSKRRRTAAEQ